MSAPVIAALCTGIAAIISSLGTAAALVIHARNPAAHEEGKADAAAD